ncbi:MAG: SLC13 family permease [Alphaproteobacteria bacterium]|nr:SLC13 family permease [Alphaproteobacteria bacterium]
MNADQAIIFVILATAMILFLWGRWRYDFVAFSALVIAVIIGLIPAEDAFLGFGHPAVITVATVLIISRSIQISGVLDHLVNILFKKTISQSLQVGALSGIGAVFSTFMNNVGALALLMPLALRLNKKPSILLMPLSFGSILGGLITLIGTPPNIIIATYRADALGKPFQLFDFAPVGLPLAIIGLFFITIIGWRLIPQNRDGATSSGNAFKIHDYISEALIPEGSSLIGKSIAELEHLIEDRSIVVGLLRNNLKILHHLRNQILQANDRLLVRIDPTVPEKLFINNDLSLPSESRLDEVNLGSENATLIETVVPPGSKIEGQSARTLQFRRRHNCALIALARQGRPIREQLSTVRFKAGDVLLFQGEPDDLSEAISNLGCLPLAERDVSIKTPKRKWLPLTIFAAAVVVTALGIIPIHISFSTAVISLILLNWITPQEAYEAIDWPVIILLGSMIPIGNALHTTGSTDLIATEFFRIAENVPVFLILALLLVITMTLSDLMNNAATAIIMGPISFAIAQQLEMNPDPFLMAVAIGASCAFLTPIGHQNNVLVMGPAGYKFGDYWRMGLPLELLIVIISIPLLMLFWPV